MANLWESWKYWNNFVGFADRSKAAGIKESNLDRGEVLTNSSSHTRTLQGKPPSTDADGNPVPAQTSDSSKIQYGTNYLEQYGDSISVQEGNKSSIQSQGWSNSVMEGISFSTTTGGSFATTGGFSIATHVGPKMATYSGLEVSTNLAHTYKIAGGNVREIYMTTKDAMILGPAISLSAKKDEFATYVSVKATAAYNTVGDKVNTCGTAISRAASRTVECVTSCFKSGDDKQEVGSQSITGASQRSSFASVRSNSGVHEIGGGVVKIG